MADGDPGANVWKQAGQGDDGTGASAGGPQPPKKYTPEQRKAALRQQQQRLILLRHASRCRAQPGTCTTTAHCAAMKTLWKHIADCKVQTCPVPHCVSSRRLLSHWHRCGDAKCAVCVPVRETIRRERSSKRGSAVAVAGGAAPRVAAASATPVPAAAAAQTAD